MVSPWYGVDKETGGELRYGSHENYLKSGYLYRDLIKKLPWKDFKKGVSGQWEKEV